MSKIRTLLSFTAALFAGTAGAQDTPVQSGDVFARYQAWQAQQALPAAELVLTGDAPNTATGSRIGGAVWLPDGASWPADRSGKRMTFLAQIDFAEMPPLPDYPTSGVVQFFIARDNLYGANFENPQQGDFKVIYHEDVSGPGRLETGPVSLGERYVDDFSPLEPGMATRGVKLAATAITHKPAIGQWQFHEAIGKGLAEADYDALYDAVYNDDAHYESNWRVGGHPEFTQSDWRYETEYRDVDRVLLQLWTSNGVMMWGDSGQGHFAMRREDLLKRDFSKVFYSWDCY